jgi:hypothetical protein
MTRKNKSPFDPSLAVRELIELGVRRKQFIKASIRVSNASGALVRRALGWQMDLPEAELKKINTKAAKILSADDASELPAELEEIATILASDIATSRAMCLPAKKQIASIELAMRKLARQFPVWSWAKDVSGFSDLGLAVVLAEAGALDRYSNKGKLWKRLGLAPITKDGKTKAASTWRKSGGLTSEEWQDTGPNGPKYSPKRRASIFSQVGNPIIGGMGKGYRPLIGEDIEQNPKLSYYEKVFVHRLRYEAARDETMRRPDTKEGKESFSKYCAFRAQRYTEKRLLLHLWQAWRRAVPIVAEKPGRLLPADEISPRGEGEAQYGLPKKACAVLPPQDHRDAPHGVDEATQGVPLAATPPLPRHQFTDAPKGADEAKESLPGTAEEGMPRQFNAAQAAGEAMGSLPERATDQVPPRKQGKAA